MFWEADSTTEKEGWLRGRLKWRERQKEEERDICPDTETASGNERKRKYRHFEEP
jgi:hypothetical protein